MDPREPHDPFDSFDPDEVPTGEDALDHLWNAAHEMLRAMRLLIDAADEFVASQRGARPMAREPRDHEGRVHRIDIDVDVRDAGASDSATGPDAAAERERPRGTGTGTGTGTGAM